MKKEISPELIAKTRAWLGEDGYNFFKDIKEKYGEINACWDESGIPHSVHFQEGMQVRNFMRGTKLCDDWSAHDFDDSWVELIEKVLNYNIALKSRYDILKDQSR